MQRGRGLIGSVMDLFAGVVILGIVAAILIHFHWDVGAAIEWAFTSLEDMVLGVAHWFSKLPFFNKMF